MAVTSPPQVELIDSHVRDAVAKGARAPVGGHRGQGPGDFYEPTLSYHPVGSLIESKSLKLYLWGFRDRGIFAEDLAATLLQDLVSACDPAEMTVDLTQQVRGGLQIRTLVHHPPK